MRSPAALPHSFAALPRAASAAVLVALAGCSSGGPVADGVEGDTDVVLAARYAVRVEVIPGPDDCVIGGLTASGVDGEAQVEQRGTAVTWVQLAPDAEGADWRLTGHICGDDADPRLRLRGGRTAAVATGDDYCLVDLSLPAGHGGRARAADRCGDADAAVVELVPDACGRWAATFPLGLRFLGDGCASQPTCSLTMRWVATPIEGVASGADGGARCGDDVGDGGIGDGGVGDGGVGDGGIGDGGDGVINDDAAPVDDATLDLGAADSALEDAGDGLIDGG